MSILNETLQKMKKESEFNRNTGDQPQTKGILSETNIDLIKVSSKFNYSTKKQEVNFYSYLQQKQMLYDKIKFQVVLVSNNYDVFVRNQKLSFNFQNNTTVQEKFFGTISQEIINYDGHSSDKNFQLDRGIRDRFWETKNRIKKHNIDQKLTMFDINKVMGILQNKKVQTIMMLTLYKDEFFSLIQSLQEQSQKNGISNDLFFIELSKPLESYEMIPLTTITCYPDVDENGRQIMSYKQDIQLIPYNEFKTKYLNENIENKYNELKNIYDKFMYEVKKEETEQEINRIFEKIESIQTMKNVEQESNILTNISNTINTPTITTTDTNTNDIEDEFLQLINQNKIDDNQLNVDDILNDINGNSDSDDIPF